MKEDDEIRAIKVLLEYDFPLEEYAADGGLTVSQKAVEFYLSTTGGGVIDADMQNFISRILADKYKNKISEGVSCDFDPDSGELVCYVNGEKEIAEVCIQPKSVRIRYRGRNKESILLPLAPKSYTVEPFVGSAANELGIRRCQELFLELYYERKYQIPGK